MKLDPIPRGSLPSQYVGSSSVRRFWPGLIILLLGFLAMNSIFIADAFRGNTVDAENAGRLGDFVGGYVGCLFTLTSVVLLFYTFKQESDNFSLEGLEYRFFELIKIHRENVSEMGVGDRYGRRTFVWLMREFREILIHVRRLNEIRKLDYSSEILFIVSYYCLFFGTGPNSTRQLQATLEEIEELDKEFVSEIIKTLGDDEIKNSAKAKRQFPYTPFEGHQSRLGHYYRHLYQTVCLVHRSPLRINKYEYIKTLRAQLSTHEQALLFVNALTPMGRRWFDEELIFLYRFVKNIPGGFFDKTIEIDLMIYFPIGYFEFQENKS